MAVPDFFGEIEIKIPRESLHRFLCDLNNLVALDPLIASVEENEPVEDLPGARWYRVRGKIAFGPLSMPVTYIAALQPISDEVVCAYVWQSPKIRIRTAYHLRTTPRGTRLFENVDVEAPWLIRRFVVSQARRAHEATLLGIKRLIEGTDPENSAGPGGADRLPLGPSD